MTDSVVKRTVESYDRMVDAYLAEWHDRGVMERHIDHFVRLVPKRHPKPIVADIGCGPGFDSAILRDRGLNVVGLDLSWGMVRAANQIFRGSYVQADMCHLPLASLFDGLWVNASLLHLPRHKVPAALSGFATALRPGGCLFLSVKEGQGEAWQEQAYGHREPRFFTYWRRDELDTLLGYAGLTIIEGWSDRQNETTTWLIRYARR